MSDYSCYITIVNSLNVDLNFANSNAVHGNWNNLDGLIKAGTRSNQCQLKNKSMGPGADGSFKYNVQIPGMKQVTFSCQFRCPVSDPNNFGVSMSGYGGVFALSNTSWGTSGHPLSVTATVDYNRSLSFTTSIRSLGLIQPAVPVLSTSNQINGATQNFEIWNPNIADSVKDGSNPAITGSYKCVSNPFNNNPNFYASLATSGSSDFDDIPITLQGSIGGMVILSNSNLNMNHSSIINLSQRYSNSPFGYAGDVAWSVVIQHTKQVMSLSASTRIEVYYINGGASEAPFFLNTAADVRLLRLLVLPASSNYGDSMTTALMKTGYKFDNVQGASGFGVGLIGGNFQMRSWLNNLTTPAQACNCCDQAALAQIGASFLFGSMNGGTWCFLSPCGYINETLLLGFGQCNNPFFGNSIFDNSLVVDINDAGRSGFSNHAFIMDPSHAQILDATSGPHGDSESLNDYIINTIDMKTTLYSGGAKQEWPQGPGTPNIVGYYLGVSQLNQPTSTAMDASLPPPIKNAVDRAMEKATVTSASPIWYSNQSISSLPDLIISQLSQISCLSRESYISPSGARLEWTFGSSPNESTTGVSLTVFADHDKAVNVMRNELATFQLPVDQLFQAPADAWRGQYELESVGKGQDVILVRGTILLRARQIGSGSGGEAGANLSSQLTDIIVDQLKRYEVDAAQWHTPNPAPISGVPGKVRVGQQFTVHASVTDVAESNANTHTGCVFLIEKNETFRTFTFVGRKAGKDKITLSFAHKNTLAVATQDLKVEVV